METQVLRHVPKSYTILVLHNKLLMVKENLLFERELILDEASCVHEIGISLGLHHASKTF